jgi:DNA-binding GntR family transcriptional regulator
MNTSKPQISLAEQAYIKLEEMIVTMRLAPGTAIAEASLSEQLGIGRTPIREALHRLARERLITILPQRGVIVSDINVGNQLKVLEVRRELERLIARSAARRADEKQVQQFREIAAQLEEAARSNDSEAFMNYDREFNKLSTVAARNEFLSGAIDLINSLSRRFWFAHFQRFADMPRSARLHANVALAIADRDVQGAADASDALLDYIEQFTRDTLAEGL